MRVIVCGGRNYYDKRHIRRFLDEFHAKTPITVLIQGGALGVDFLAKHWGNINSIRVEEYAMDIKANTNNAGHVRNLEMIIKGKPDLVIAFPGGKGTRNMIRQARENNIPVVVTENEHCIYPYCQCLVQPNTSGKIECRKGLQRLEQPPYIERKGL